MEHVACMHIKCWLESLNDANYFGDLGMVGDIKTDFLETGFK
jgi:hypothetical protein